VAETSFPTAGGGAVTDANYEVLMASATGDGLIGRPSFSALIYGDSSGRQVKVRGSRGAIVRGFRWQTDSGGLTVPIAANASGQSRIDTVVLRLNRSNYTVRVAVLQGTPSATPVAPSPLYQDPPSQYFDMPLAQVTVANGATIISAGNVSETTWYLAEPMLITKSSFSPPSVMGRMMWQYDQNALWVADSSGGYDNVQRDSGWISITPSSGWGANTGLKMRRKGDVMFVSVSLIRTGGGVGASTDSVIGTISTTSYRPESVSATGVFYCSSPDHAGNIYILPSNGQIVLNATNSLGINNGAYIYASLTFPVAG
jgi:hypothetical protein